MLNVIQIVFVDLVQVLTVQAAQDRVQDPPHHMRAIKAQKHRAEPLPEVHQAKTKSHYKKSPPPMSANLDQSRFIQINNSSFQVFKNKILFC